MIRDARPNGAHRALATLERHGALDLGEEGVAVARSAMDAPEVDPRVFIENAHDVAVGDRLSVRVEAVTEELDLVGERA